MNESVRHIILTILFIVFCQLTIQAQFFEGTIIKTRPFQDFVVFNPTLGLEKPITNTISIETELMYRNRNWDSSGGEGDFGSFYNGDGFRILIGSKMYFGNYNRNLYRDGKKAPFGWFTTIQISYSLALTYDIDKHHNTGMYEYTVDSNRDWFEVNVGLGKQYYLFNTLSMEIYFGPTLISAQTEKMTITKSEDVNVVEGSEIESYSDAYIRPFVSLTIGYYIK